MDLEIISINSLNLKILFLALKHTGNIEMADPKLKEAMAEIRGICKKHDIAGYITLVSETHSEFGLEITPTWSAAHWEDKTQGALRFRVKEAEVGKEKAKKLTELTCHMIYQIRDLCAQGFMYMEKMTGMIEEQIKVEHKSFSGFEPHVDQ